MRSRWMLALVSCCVLAGVGCTPSGDYSARFLRYDTLPDGTRVAVVAPVSPDADPEQIAYSRLDDLRPGEVVIIEWVGRSWETPQWMPEREVVARR